MRSNLKDKNKYWGKQIIIILYVLNFKKVVAPFPFVFMDFQYTKYST